MIVVIKYDPTHVCGKKPAAELHVMETDDTTPLIFDEILNMFEQAD